MLLLFLCSDTIPVSSCRPSCEASCCKPHLSGCGTVASSHLSTAPMTAPTPSCGMDPATSPSGSGCRMRTSLSATSKPAQKWTPCLAVHDAVADRWASTQAAPPPPSGSHFQTRWFLHLLLLRCRQATVQELFFQSQTGFLHALDRRRHPCLYSSGTRTVSGHRHRGWTSDLSSCRPTPKLEGSPAETGVRPWLTVKPIGLVL
jgi:hypothetical protein